MKRTACVLLLSTAGWAQLQPGNFDIRLNTDAKLQTGAQIPFRIAVVDSLGKPVDQAKVVVTIEHPDHTKVATFKAPMLDHGLYLAKPEFPEAGQWNMIVHVERDHRESARTNTYTIPD